MSKPYKTISDLVVKKIKKYATIGILTIAGISFTLFPTPDGINYENDKFAIELNSSTSSSSDFNDNIRLNDNVEIKLAFNRTPGRALLDEAYAAYIDSESKSELNETFNDSYKEIADALENIKFEKVSVSGNPANGLLRVAFRLPGKLMLSVIKSVGLHPSGIVGFNILRNRQLLLSDILPVKALATYVKNIENRLPKLDD